MNDRLIVYTTIINRYDTLKSPLVVDPNIRYVCITDEPLPDVPPWKQRIVAKRNTSPRRHARLYKIMAHGCFPLAEYSLYIDGRIQLKIYPVEVLGWLKEHDMATFKHPRDSCLYWEAHKCSEWGLDDPGIINEQMKRYKAERYPKDNGLSATSVILRRHTEAIRRFNGAWWLEILFGSLRDQLSFEYVRWKLGLGRDVIPGRSVESNPWFHYRPHDGETAWRREEKDAPNGRHR